MNRINGEERVKMRFIKLFQVLLLIIAVGFLSGCEYYSEGDSVAEQTWKKMSIKEKAYYEKVEGAWGEKPLMRIREAIRKREVAPEEQELPFLDIADLIVTTNDMNLVLNENEMEDVKKKKVEARWSAIDVEWYNKILYIAGKTTKPQASQTPLPSFNVPKQERENQKRNQNEVNTTFPPTISSQIRNDAYGGLNQVLSSEEFGKLSYEMSNCPRAIEYIQSAIMQNRPLTYGDMEAVKLRMLLCDTENIDKFSLNN